MNHPHQPSSQNLTAFQAALDASCVQNILHLHSPSQHQSTNVARMKRPLAPASFRLVAMRDNSHSKRHLPAIRFAPCGLRLLMDSGRRGCRKRGGLARQFLWWASPPDVRYTSRTVIPAHLRNPAGIQRYSGSAARAGRQMDSSLRWNDGLYRGIRSFCDSVLCRNEGCFSRSHG
jgi:hypothetical protein